LIFTVFVAVPPLRGFTINVTTQDPPFNPFKEFPETLQIFADFAEILKVNFAPFPITIFASLAIDATDFSFAMPIEELKGEGVAEVFDGTEEVVRDATGFVDTVITFQLL